MEEADSLELTDQDLCKKLRGSWLLVSETLERHLWRVSKLQ